MTQIPKSLLCLQSKPIQHVLCSLCHASRQEGALVLCTVLMSACHVQFVSRPFVVGDRVELKTASGGSVVTGLVERIAPMSTTIRNDQNIPISIPNK